MTADRDIPATVEWPTGWTVRCVDSTGSTNDDLIRAAARGDLTDRTVLVAAHQTAGRGRLGRTWDAPTGANLLASIYFAALPTYPAEITQRVGLAIVTAVSELGEPDGHRILLKWPNDVLVGDDKLAGVLAQRSADGPGVVVGFGVNVGWAPPGAAWLNDPAGLARRTEPHSLLAAVLRELDAQPADIAPHYRDRLATIGQLVRVLLPGGREQVGRAVRVTADGALVVAGDDGVEHRFDAGDVIHLRPR
ncbi:MAG: biotin--[acetyl-CoA-carboxylase] ligase [Ilumatobacter sp.]|nr:biotin--[acetyl-CoA-carboxylase] ligase [Ilumatobacter sp.]